MHYLEEIEEDISWKPMDDAIIHPPKNHHRFHSRSKGGWKSVMIGWSPFDQRDPSNAVIVLISHDDISFQINSDSIWTIELSLQCISISVSTDLVCSCQDIHISIGSENPHCVIPIVSEYEFTIWKECTMKYSHQWILKRCLT